MVAYKTIMRRATTIGDRLKTNRRAETRVESTAIDTSTSSKSMRTTTAMSRWTRSSRNRRKHQLVSGRTVEIMPNRERLPQEVAMMIQAIRIDHGCSDNPPPAQTETRAKLISHLGRSANNKDWEIEFASFLFINIGPKFISYTYLPKYLPKLLNHL